MPTLTHSPVPIMAAKPILYINLFIVRSRSMVSVMEYAIDLGGSVLKFCS